MKLAVFYHVAQLNGQKWKLLYQQQIHNIVFSGLYDSIDYFSVGVSGNDPLPEVLPKMQVEINRDHILEADTLKRLHDFCSRNQDYSVLYIHTKGISYADHPRLEYNKNRWRLYLEYYNIFNWRKNVELLQTYDCVGTEHWPDAWLQKKYINAPHYAGNFWWATASYISKLDSNYLYDPKINGIEAARYKSEFWIGTGNPKFYNHTNLVPTINDLYEERYYLPSDYTIKNQEPIEITVEESQSIVEEHQLIPPNRGLVTDIPNKKTKIVMITMFKNEAHTIGRMLESCYKYIDYYVIQDNGSTDGTPQVVENFFKDKNIPGYVYKCHEGWVGFGWNRDHLLQQCQKTDHGCDWILKMDCDETLEVDDDFDWSTFENHEIQSFHIPNVRGGTIYNRAWLWNSKFPWRFNHDTAHETIVLDVEGIGENFQRVNLPRSFRHISFDDGQSWSSPTKFLSDALKLEERLIRENTILEDRYHFWYIGKSYSDAYKSGQFPLENHTDEYARRTIWYFEKYLDYTHDNFTKTGIAHRFDEMAYYAGLLIAHAYGFLGDKHKKVEWLLKTDQLCSRRNEHLVNLAETYMELGQYDKMLETTSRAVRPERTNPFPDLMFIIDSNCYHDTGSYVVDLHNKAQAMANENTNKFNLNLNTNKNKRVFVVDNFYADPDSVREYAMQLDFAKDLRWYKGLRTTTAYRPNEIKDAFESIIGEKIVDWEGHGFNGVFQLTTAEDPQVYHYDSQKWAAMIYLTPNAPIHSGTRLHQSLISGARRADDPGVDLAFSYGFYDSTKFDIVDDMGNIYNRLVIMDARNIHSAGAYFGQNLQNGRLIHLFFFD